MFLASQADSWWQLLPLCGFLVLAFCEIKLLHKFPVRGLYITIVASLLALFLYLKQYTIVQFMPVIGFSYVTIGLSYILFRTIHVTTDIYQGELQRGPSFRCFLAYTCAFTTLASGPIQRYQDFLDQEQELDNIRLSREDVADCLSRMINGWLKIVIFSAAFYSWFSLLQGPYFGQLDGTVSLAAYYGFACILYLLYMYVNFSGYMDVVIGMGRLLGFNLPENFDWPLSSGSFLEFWSRWHITLSEWFKIYVFNPLAAALVRRFGQSWLGPYVGAFAYFGNVSSHGDLARYPWSSS